MLIKPMSDLCWTCQQNSTAIVRAANKPETAKLATIVAAQDHLFAVQLKRSFYKTTCDLCKQSIRGHITVMGSLLHLSHIQTFLQTPTALQYIIHSTMRSKSISRWILYSLDLSFSSVPASAASSELIVKLYCDK